MKDCKKCINYNKEFNKCLKYKCDVTDHKVFASICTEYFERQRKKVKCKSCKNLNKYGYCSMKKICMNDEDKNKERFCRNYFQRKYKKH